MQPDYLHIIVHGKIHSGRSSLTLILPSIFPRIISNRSSSSKRKGFILRLLFFLFCFFFLLVPFFSLFHSTRDLCLLVLMKLWPTTCHLYPSPKHLQISWLAIPVLPYRHRIPQWEKPWWKDPSSGCQPSPPPLPPQSHPLTPVTPHLLLRPVWVILIQLMPLWQTTNEAFMALKLDHESLERSQAWKAQRVHWKWRWVAPQNFTCLYKLILE